MNVSHYCPQMWLTLHGELQLHCTERRRVRVCGLSRRWSSVCVGQSDVLGGEVLQHHLEHVHANFNLTRARQHARILEGNGEIMKTDSGQRCVDRSLDYLVQRKVRRNRSISGEAAFHRIPIWIVCQKNNSGEAVLRHPAPKQETTVCTFYFIIFYCVIITETASYRKEATVAVTGHLLRERESDRVPRSSSA